MKFNDLRAKIKDSGLFSFEDIFKWFPQANRQTVKNQLRKWVEKGYLLRVKKNLYFLQEHPLNDEFVLANKIYQPSYVSLESALNYYGIIPDVPFAVTSVTTKKTQEFKTPLGLFLYRKIKFQWFFGWEEIEVEKNQSYKIASPPKALFDFIWLNKNSFGKNFPAEERFSFDENFNWQEFKRYTKAVEDKKFQKLVEKLEVFYAQ